MTTSFNKYYASWKNEIPKKMFDNISKRSPTMMMLLGKKKDWSEGGDTIQPHLKYAHATNAGSYRGYDSLDITPQQTRTDAEFRMKQLYASLVYNGYEVAASKGPNAIFSMAEIAMKDAEDAMFNILATQVFSDGTGNGGKDLLGLAAAIDDGTNVANYAGIDRTTAAWWKSVYNGSVGAITLAKLRSPFRQASRGGMKNSPDYMVAGGDAWDFISSLTDSTLQHNIPVNNVGKMFANMGFPFVNLFGVPLVYDEYCPADELYMLNSETTRLWVKPGLNMTPTEVVKPANMDARIGQILFGGELICTEPRANVHLKGILAPA
jgi:hypothetical protein